jgi:hypothetical protein
MLIADVSEVKLPGEAKQNNLPPECGQPIDGVMAPVNAIYKSHAVQKHQSEYDLTSLICLYVFIKSTLSLRNGAFVGSRNETGIRFCMAVISVLCWSVDMVTRSSGFSWRPYREGTWRLFSCPGKRKIEKLYEYLKNI